MLMQPNACFGGRLPQAKVILGSGHDSDEPWLEQTKTVAGFLVLVAMFKYLANVDEVLHWGLITRERVLAAWFVLSLVAPHCTY
jgi:hypothetical protein